MQRDYSEVRGHYNARRFERRELVEIKLRASALARQPGSNPFWVKAYENLAQAADVLDAIIARAVLVSSERDNSRFDRGYDNDEEEVDHIEGVTTDFRTSDSRDNGKSKARRVESEV